MASGTGPQNGAGPGDYGEGFDGPNKSDTARMKREARDNPDNQNPSRTSTADSPSSSSSRSSPLQGSRAVVGLMFFATSFALIGNEIEDKAGSPITSGSKIILGGVTATALLTLVSHGGETGRQFAVGIALVTAATSLLVFGGTPSKPGGVWKLLANQFSSTPTKPTSTTAATKPTTGTATAVALASAA